ncbi:hypothetical protein QEH42_gp175 [Microbacterium phage Pumpernickel]|uniref:Uncharacterized protein n=1 Tax=Microbacterium phage Pumpernickel TaxID=2885983 RepID=A0AAE8Y7U5_9CAUD|nr:hypothetical protein QEH42_gp175 [Microbacterium phage Pumpernickel]UDL16043.1 hypothetical protein SEA_PUMPERNICKEL_293 [Microbacterium phage Pumpernickel]
MMADPFWNYENPRYCDVFWGSHGCSLVPFHVGPCICDHRDRDADGNPIGDILIITEPPGVPPYYGPDTEFFSNNPHSVIPAATLRAVHWTADNLLIEE